MKILLSGPAWAAEPESDDEITDPKRVRALDGLVYVGGSCGHWMDVEFLDIGLVGGLVSCAYSETDGLSLVTEYRAPRPLTDEELRRLADDTSGQWSDGLGENGFRFETTGGAIDVRFGGGRDLRVVQEDDSQAVPPPSMLSLAARSGDLMAVSLAMRSEDLEVRVQGLTPLHWAIVHGHADVCALLLNHGANPNATDPLGETPLLMVAASNLLDDRTSAIFAEMLLGRGADREIADPTGETPRSMAANRGKTELIELLARQT